VGIASRLERRSDELQDPLGFVGVDGRHDRLLRLRGVAGGFW
jgi:hypothetical protein